MVARDSTPRAVRLLQATAAVCFRGFRLRNRVDGGGSISGVRHGLHRFGRHRSHGARPCALTRFVALIALVSSSLWSLPSHAVTVVNDWQTAMAQCKASAATAATNGNIVTNACGAGMYSTYNEWVLEYKSQYANPSYHHLDFPYRGAPPSNPCTGPDVPNLTGVFPGRILASSSWCKSGVPDPVSGGTVSCVMTFNTSGPPTRNQWGKWATPGTLASTGSTCDGTSGGGSNNWKNSDGSPAGDPIPPSPATDPPKDPGPKTCGGGSCYDPNNDNFCAVADGKQVCVSGGDARGDNGGSNAGTPNGKTPGACSSSGSATVCAGSPSAPVPSPNNVPDPPTQVTSNDTYTQSNPSTGAPIVVQTTTYNSGSASSGSSAPTSGQQTGDSGPASSSSSGGPEGSFGGGGDCNTPPICSGDVAVCGFARQSWALQCQIHGDLKGLGDTSAIDAADHSMGPDADPDTMFADGADAGNDPNAGILGSLDSSGFLGGGSSCPLLGNNVEVEGQTIVDWGPLCQASELLSSLILALAYVSATFIIARGRAGV